MRRHTIRGHAFALVIAASGSVATGAAVEEHSLRDILEREMAKLESPQPRERQEAVRTITQCRDILMRRLVALAGSSYEEGTFFSSKEMAIDRFCLPPHAAGEARASGQGRRRTCDLPRRPRARPRSMG